MILSRFAREEFQRRTTISFFGMRVDRELLKLLPFIRRLGVVAEVSWGVECFSQRVLRIFKKGINVDDCAPLLKGFAEAGVTNHLYMLFGLPCMEDEDVRITFANIQDIRPFYATIRSSWFLLFSGTDVFSSPEEFGLVVGKRYRVFDGRAQDWLGDYNLQTKIFDFASVIGGRLLTRQLDFARYVDGFVATCANGACYEAATPLFMLRDPTPDHAFARRVFGAPPRRRRAVVAP
jgi:radical SAM superfamily enzyme YgiQ (UPF0313 family)